MLSFPPQEARILAITSKKGGNNRKYKLWVNTAILQFKLPSFLEVTSQNQFSLTTSFLNLFLESITTCQ